MFSLNDRVKVKKPLPLWVLGASVIEAVSGTGLAVTASVASLVRLSSLPASSVKLTLTWTVLPWWFAVRVRVDAVAASMSTPDDVH